MDGVYWGLLGYVIFPLWLVAGVLDYWTHQRTSIAHTAGPRESRLHLAQTVQVGLPVLVVLFLELNLLALALLVAAAVAHTLTAYWDVHYASQHRVILPIEQVVHSFLFTLPLFATALLLVMHWPVLQTPGEWALRLRDPPWDTRVITAVLASSLLLAIVPALAEWWQVRSARGGEGRAPDGAMTGPAVTPD